MEYTYTEYHDDQPGDEKMRVTKTEKINDEVEIVIRIKMDKKKYDARRAKYQEPLWVKAAKIFMNVH